MRQHLAGRTEGPGVEDVGEFGLRVGVGGVVAVLLVEVDEVDAARRLRRPALYAVREVVQVGPHAVAAQVEFESKVWNQILEF